jgi:hypothetical protein
MASIIGLFLENSGCEVRNIGYDGIGLFTNKKVEVGSNVTLSLLLSTGGLYDIKGQVRWRMGDKSLEGVLKKVEFAEGGKEITEKEVVKDGKPYKNLEDVFGEKARGFQYSVGIKLYEPLNFSNSKDESENYMKRGIDASFN